MAQSIQALRERRSTRAQELHTLLNENPGDKWNANLQAQYDQGMAEIEEVEGEIKRHQALMDKIAEDVMNGDLRDAQGRQVSNAAKKTGSREMYAKWLRGGDKALTAEDWADIRATMSTTTGSEGGYSVQSEVASQLIEALKAYGGMRDVATLIRTDMGNPLSFPTTDGTAETGEWIAENVTATAADPTFGTVAVNAFKASSKIVAVPFELLQDSQVDIEAFVNGRLADRLGRITNTGYTVGTGTAQPFGVVTRAASGKVGTTGQTTTIIYDDLVDLIHSVDPAYRASGRVRFMMNDASLKVIRKLKDSSNRPIFIPGYELNNSMPDTLLGYEITINQDMPVMAANAKSVLFGDFSKYIVRDVMAGTLFRFTDSAYAKLGQVGFLMWMRTGGNLVDTGAVKYYQNSAT
ncbi:MAG: phage major capsid protein [Aeromonas veronii]